MDNYTKCRTPDTTSETPTSITAKRRDTSKYIQNTPWRSIDVLCDEVEALRCAARSLTRARWPGGLGWFCGLPLTPECLAAPTLFVIKYAGEAMG